MIYKCNPHYGFTQSRLTNCHADFRVWFCSKASPGFCARKKQAGMPVNWVHSIKRNAFPYRKLHFSLQQLSSFYPSLPYLPCLLGLRWQAAEWAIVRRGDAGRLSATPPLWGFFDKAAIRDYVIVSGMFPLKKGLGKNMFKRWLKMGLKTLEISSAWFKDAALCVLRTSAEACYNITARWVLWHCSLFIEAVCFFYIIVWIIFPC